MGHRPPTTAMQRLGYVLGWTGLLLALPFVGLGLYGLTNAGGDAFVKWASIIVGVGIFLIGRALRYILAGD